MRDGVASVRRAPGGCVHGLLWNLALADVPVLDAFEEIAAGKYAKVMHPVARDIGAVRALVYVGRTAEEGRPRPGYLEGIIASGTATNLPAPYLRSLAAILKAGTRGPPFVNGGPGPSGPVPGVTPRFASPMDER